VIRRSVAATAAGLAALACCLAGSLFQHVRLVARVDDTSAWVALHRHWSFVYASWRASVTAADWLLFAGVAVLAAAAVVARPTITRFASARRRTE
jgi:hypothetical protein